MIPIQFDSIQLNKNGVFLLHVGSMKTDSSIEIEN